MRLPAEDLHTIVDAIEVVSAPALVFSGLLVAVWGLKKLELG